jgi:hypothetical protein
MHSLKDFANDIEEDFSNKQCMQFGPREEVIADMVDAFQCGGSDIIDLVGEAITPKDDYSEFSDSSEESEDDDSYYRRRSANRRRQQSSRRRTPQGTRPRNSRRGHKNSRARSCSPNTLQEKRSRRKSLQERRSRRKSTRARNYRGEIAATP